MLRDEGYHVLEAADGHAALAASDAYPGKIDLLLTDLIMPGMTGRMLADLLTARRPGIIVGFISGHVGDSPSSQAEQAAFFIQKPVIPETIFKKIADALSGKRDR